MVRNINDWNLIGVSQMGFLDRFKGKKWEDKDPQVRMEGIEELAKDKKNGAKNQKILLDLLKNDQNTEVRMLAIEKSNNITTIMDIALTDSDWRIRKAAVERIRRYMDSNIYFFPETHHSENEKYMNVIEKVAKTDSNSEVRDAADSLANNPKYSKKALAKQHENDAKKISYTVVDASRKSEKTVILNLNDKFEYVCEANSVMELMECCFGGDIITVTYCNLSDGNDKDLIVDYNILDSHVSHPDKKKIEATDFDRIVTYENADTQKFTGKMYKLTQAEIAENIVVREVLRHYLKSDDRFFQVKKGDNIEIGFVEITDFLRSQNIDVPNLFMPKIRYRVENIEFISRKAKQIPNSENLTVYRQ